MELLRRALLIGCLLPGLWLMRLAPLDPLLTVVPVDFAALQKQEASTVPDEAKTDAQRRRAEIPLSVYIEESLEYNVFSAAGLEWERFLADLDTLWQEASPRSGVAWRASQDPRAASGSVRYAFFRQDEEPMSAVLDKLAAGGGATYISISRPGGDSHYRVERRVFTRRDFQPGAGFNGSPAPPATLLFPFRGFGGGFFVAGLVLFFLLAGARRDGARARLTALEVVAFVGAIVFFFVPLLAVGGSVQALTRGLFLTIPSWILAALGVHFFAGPLRNAPDLPIAEPAGRSETAANAGAGVFVSTLFLREGMAFLAMALGPLVFLVSASMILWNR